MMNHFLKGLWLPIFWLATTSAFAQNVNWKRMNAEAPNQIQVAAGLNYGATASASYGHLIDGKFPILLDLSYSSPMGKQVFDDFKVNLGGQIKLWQGGNFAASINITSVFRQYTSRWVRLENFGSDMGATLGYYRSHWYLAGACSFDKAITTHVKNSAEMRDVYPDIQNGWYIPTGGNFSYGLQTGVSFGENDLFMDLGRVVTQDFKTGPFLPFYLHIGFGRRF